jgi:hypothetical protein
MKYVDDLLMIIPKKEVEITLTIVNGYNKNLKFTMELEDDGSLPYLDVELIKQEDGRILAKWYSKPMASNRLLNFKSNHTLKQKLNTALNLMKRVCHLTTINTARENLPTIRSILEKNNYRKTGLFRTNFSFFVKFKRICPYIDVSQTYKLRYDWKINSKDLLDFYAKNLKIFQFESRGYKK